MFWLDRVSGEARQLTHSNDELFAQLNLTEPEEIRYKSFDGKSIQAWLQKPPGFDPAKKYPLILNIHGGPHAAYGYIFEHEFQWMAAKGYVVLYPNPRGSTSYGQEFGNVIQYHYPGDDYKDLMPGVDETIKRGYIDEKKLGVTGGSGGGLLTNWVIGHTDRFAAAVSQRDIASWTDWWYTADFTLFQPTWFKAPPFQDPEDFKARSPITYINNVKTPLDVHSGRKRYPHSARRGRRADVSRAEVPQDSDGDGEVSQRNARAVAVRPAVASGGTAAAHRGLVRSLADGSGEAGIRRRAGRRSPGETKRARRRKAVDGSRIDVDIASRSCRIISPEQCTNLQSRDANPPAKLSRHRAHH